MAEEFQLVAGNLALDFANTLDNRYDRERLVELLPTYESFVAFVMQAGIITRRQGRRLLMKTRAAEAKRALKRVRGLREALYFLFQSVAARRRPKESRLRTLNRFLAEVRVADAVQWGKGGFVRGCRDLAETPEGPLWAVLDAAARLLTTPDRRQVRECSEKRCRWLFLDRSKNHSRRWCDMQVCGNRQKARRFWERRRSVVKGQRMRRRTRTG
jgi:predicted RNA-binding Zn ribbon-like protein